MSDSLITEFRPRSLGESQLPINAVRLTESGTDSNGWWRDYSDGIRIVGSRGIALSSTTVAVTYPNGGFTKGLQNEAYTRPQSVSLDCPQAQLTTIGSLNASLTGFSLVCGTSGGSRSASYIAIGYK